MRICVDLCKLTESVKSVNLTLPAIDQILGQVSGARFFSKLDAKSGFWRIELSEESRKLKCLIMPYGRHMYNRHPLGLSSSSEYFQKRMSLILERLPGIMCLIYGTTEQDYNERLDVVLKKLQTAQLTLDAQKCEFKKRTKQCVGYIIGSNGVQADPQTLSIVGYGITSGR